MNVNLALKIKSFLEVKGEPVLRIILGLTELLDISQMLCQWVIRYNWAGIHKQKLNPGILKSLDLSQGHIYRYLVNLN